MPAAIGVAILGEVGLDAIIGSTLAGVSAETLVGYAALTVGTIGLQYGAQALLGGEKRADHQITVRQAVAPRRRVLGQAKLGGVIFALDTLKHNDTNTIMYRGAVHCVGPVAILQYWLGDVKTGLAAGPGGSVPDSVYQGKVVIEGHAGTDDQPASSALLKLPYWSASKRLAGLCYSVVVATPLKKGSQIFPEGAPDVRLLVAGAPSYDPRSGTYAYTDNAAIVLLDYLTHASGYGLALAEIDLASFAALADVCDEPVALVVPDPNGATAEMRYRSWGAYDYTEVLARPGIWPGKGSARRCPTRGPEARDHHGRSAALAGAARAIRRGVVVARRHALQRPDLPGPRAGRGLAHRPVQGRADRSVPHAGAGPGHAPRDRAWAQHDLADRPLRAPARALESRLRRQRADLPAADHASGAGDGRHGVGGQLPDCGPRAARVGRLRRAAGPGRRAGARDDALARRAPAHDRRSAGRQGPPGILAVAVRPWLRDTYPAGTAIMFGAPVGTMRLASDDTAAMSLQLSRTGTVKIEFVEAFYRVRTRSAGSCGGWFRPLAEVGKVHARADLRVRANDRSK
ncbi:MAG: hypothetical protein MIL41_09260 [Hyphomicrobiales bacterium]|jgi:hypothetical protein